MARVRGATRLGTDARLVDVEADQAPSGVPAFRLVGVSRACASGTEHRLRAAMRNGGFAFPKLPVTVNLAPASLPKEGPPLDLAIALAVLATSDDVLRVACRAFVLHGELSLDGRVRPAPGALAAAEAARAAGLERFICAPRVALEAAAVRGVEVHGADSLWQAVAAVRGEGAPPVPSPEEHVEDQDARTGEPDLADVKGQLHARRALEVAAAGGHGLLLVGPPGAGKSMLARRLPGLLPPLSLDEALDVTRIRSVAGLRLSDADASRGGLARRRPFRAPHHAISGAGLLGGGQLVGPGEITLAHHGVLFLDETPEFRRDVLEGLRQPLEDGCITIVRVAARATMPCRFTLVAAANPCPCGWHGSRRRACTCTDAQVARYRARLSGPLLDRLDLQVEVPPLAFAELSTRTEAESSATVRTRVRAARDVQLHRQGKLNAALTPAGLRATTELGPRARALMAHAVDRLGLSGRAHDRVLKLALTIHDLALAKTTDEGSRHPRVRLDSTQVAEALSYRLLDRAPLPDVVPDAVQHAKDAP